MKNVFKKGVKLKDLRARSNGFCPPSPFLHALRCFCLRLLGESRSVHRSILPIQDRCPSDGPLEASAPLLSHPPHASSLRPVQRFSVRPSISTKTLQSNASMSGPSPSPQLSWVPGASAPAARPPKETRRWNESKHKKTTYFSWLRRQKVGAWELPCP